jgi:two-component system phosphate regulon response regulator PhoB
MNISEHTNKVLIVEDEIDMRFFLSTLLKTNGLTPISASNGIEGIEKAKAAPPDLVILDMMMPKQGGALMYRHLKTDKLLTDIPVIILSAVPRQAFLHYLSMLNIHTAGKTPQPDAYIEKPPEPGHLLVTIRRLLASV